MISEKTDAQAPTENRLAGEKSPYLLQHADNPVNWHPWGQEALDRARQENKPVFLSIGYATCHWCHVMAHESFEDEQVAEVLNRDYVSIKVDREERPDIDLIYMNACQAMTRSGGWPLSIFMSPEGKPFFAGTYFPKESRMGMPGFMDLLHRIKDLWDKDRERLLRMGEEVLKALQTPPNTAGEEQLPDESTLGKGFEQLHSIFDATHGGFGSAPKFPTPHNLMFLLRWHRRTQDPEALQCVEKTLQAMRNGGIFDQVGFGFSRYSVDEKWLVPHFEKMLYDQAQLAMAYIETYQSTGGSRYANVAREIFTYVRRDMTSPGGGFYSAEDADSEGREGLFYVWKPEEIREILGPDAGELFCKFYNIVPEGNFEDGLSIPHITREQETFAREEGIPAETLGAQLEDAREKLFQARCGRIHPLKDDKILTSWNGLMIAALARGSRALADPSLAEAAGKAAEFILYRLSPSRGTLLRRYRDGEAALPGYVDDYAFFIWGLIELYEATFQVRYLEEAVVLQESMLDLFQDADRGGFFFSGRENESLIVRSKEAYDQALPSGNSVAAMNLLRLGRMTGNPAWEQQAERTAQAFAGSIRIAPAGHTQFLAAVDFMVGPSQEVVITGAPESPVTGEMIREVHGRFLPRAVLLLKPPGENGKRIQALAPFLEEMEPKEGGSAAFVCEQYACRRPVTDLEGLRDSLDTC